MSMRRAGCQGDGRALLAVALHGGRCRHAGGERGRERRGGRTHLLPPLGAFVEFGHHAVDRRRGGGAADLFCDNHLARGGGVLGGIGARGRARAGASLGEAKHALIVRFLIYEGERVKL